MKKNSVILQNSAFGWTVTGKLNDHLTAKLLNVTLHKIRLNWFYKNSGTLNLFEFRMIQSAHMITNVQLLLTKQIVSRKVLIKLVYLAERDWKELNINFVVTKGWYVCLCTKAMHLDFVTGLSTQTFIACLVSLLDEANVQKSCREMHKHL